MKDFVPLGDVVEIKGGGTPSRAIPEYWDGEIPWATVKDFKSTIIDSTLERITAKGATSSATNIIPAGAIIIPTRMAVGKVAINKVDLAINQDLKALLPTKEVDANFLLHFLLSQAEYLESRAQGATVKGIKLDLLRSLSFPRLSLNEQRRIAAILDTADNICRKCEKSLAMADELLKSVFLQMFGDPINNPKGLCIDEIGRYLSKARPGTQSGPFGSSLKKHEYVDEGVPVWGVGFAMHIRPTV
jgi:type I restriction enzyme S subunit